MEEKFPPKEFAEFYYHDIDYSGSPYFCPVNPVHTVFALKGSDEAIEKAIVLVNKTECDAITIREMLGFRIIDIEINNFIADLYDDMIAIPGMEEVLYFIYDKAHERLITNDRNRRLLAVLDLPDYDEEIADEDMLFPEHTELSLPTE